MTREDALNQYTYNAGVIERIKTELDRLVNEQKSLKAIIFAQQLPESQPKQIRQPYGAHIAIVGKIIQDFGAPIKSYAIRELCNLSPDQIQQAIKNLLKKNIIHREGTHMNYTYTMAVHKEVDNHDASHGIA